MSFFILGAIYGTVLDVPPDHRSALNSIFLIGMFNSKDAKHVEIGWDVILKDLNADLERLESVSIG